MLITSREVDVGLTTTWDPTFGDFLEKTFQYYPKNLDHNSGDPLGIAVCQQSTMNGRRVTASGAFLSTRPSNLIVMTDTAVTRVLVQDKKAIGVAVGEQKSMYHHNSNVFATILHRNSIRAARSHTFSRIH